MPHLRAIGQLLPLRSQTQHPRAKNLLDHHKTHHPKEESLRPFTLTSSLGTSRTGYDLFGRFVECGTGSAPHMRISEVAALALEQTFGKADTLEEIFSVPWATPENRNPGSIFWDTTNDRIIARAREGFILALKGTNLVEAAVYLPRIYEEIKQHLSKNVIPEKVDIIEAVVEDPIEEWSMAASPLHIKCRLNNLERSSDPYTLSYSVKATVEKALKNRIDR